MFPLTTVEIRGQGGGINDSGKLLGTELCNAWLKKKKRKKNPMNAGKIRFGKFVGVSTSMSRKPFCGNTVRNS